MTIEPWPPRIMFQVAPPSMVLKIPAEAEA